LPLFLGFVADLDPLSSIFQGVSKEILHTRDMGNDYGQGFVRIARAVRQPVQGGLVLGDAQSSIFLLIRS